MCKKEIGKMLYRIETYKKCAPEIYSKEY